MTPSDVDSRQEDQRIAAEIAIRNRNRVCADPLFPRNDTPSPYQFRTIIAVNP